MRSMIWLVAITIALFGAGLGVWQLAAQDDDDSYGNPAPTGTVEYAPPGATPISTGRQPPSVAEPTATLDLSAAVPPAEAWTALSADPKLAAVLDAFEDRDADGLMQLVGWRNQPCGSPQGSTEACPVGVERLTELEMVDVGDTVSFWVLQDTLRGRFGEILAGDDLDISFASRLTEGDNASLYLLALEGPARQVSPSAIWAPPEGTTGVFLTIDTSLEHPILKLSFLSPEWTGAQQASNRQQGFTGQEIITFME